MAGKKKPVDFLIGFFVKALTTGKLSKTELSKLSSNWGSGLKVGEGQNRQALHQATRKLAKQKPDFPKEDIAKHRGNWAPVFGIESFSPEYSGWWVMSFAVLFGEQWWNAVGKVWIEANALAALEKPPKEIRLTTYNSKTKKTETTKRTLSGKKRSATGSEDWRWGNAPFSQMPGPRFLWDPTLTTSTIIQRSIAHPCLGLALGLEGVKIPEFEHHSMGLPLAVLLGRKPSKKGTNNATKPDSWGTVKLGKAAVNHLDWLPKLPKGVWIRYQWFEDGSKFVGMSQGKTNTRGTVPLSKSSKKGVVTYYTAAMQAKKGSWTRCGAEWDGKKWIVSTTGSAKVKIPAGSFSVKVPGKPTMEVLWDSEGARELGKSTPSTSSPKPSKPPKSSKPSKLPKAAVKEASTLASKLPDLIKKVKGADKDERTALLQIRNHGNQIVANLKQAGGIGEAQKLARNVPVLAKKVKAAKKKPAEKTTLKQIRNHGQEIMKLLEA